MKTVVMLDFSDVFRDGQKQLVALAQHTQAQGLSVVLACLRSTPLASRDVPLASRSTQLPSRDVPLAGPDPSTDSDEIPRLLLRGRFGHFLWLYPLLSRLKLPGTILHAHGWQAAQAALLCKYFLPKLPLVLTFRGTWLLRHTPSFVAAWRLRRVCAAAQTVCCATQELAAVLQTFGADESKIRLCPPIFPKSAPNPEPAERFVFLAAAALESDSGFTELLDAMAMVQGTEHLPPWELRIVGQGDQFAALLEKATQLGVESRLALLGEQDVDEQLAFAHVAISSARHSREQHLFLLRAWARRLPFLTTGTPEMLEFVVDRQNALVSQPGNAVALGANIAHCLTDPELRRRISRGGEACFSAKAESITALY